MAATSEAQTTPPTEEWPMEVRALFAALTRPSQIPRDRRSRPRADCHARALLRVAQARTATGVEIYLRDYDDRAVSYVTREMVPVDRNMVLELTDVHGRQRHIVCRVGRCRQFREGWFEGVLHTAE
jgi:hypothetical protein